MSTITNETPLASDDETKSRHDANRDPISGRAGAHPIGTGLGAAAGGLCAGIQTGVVAGIVAGPVGAVVGATVGAVAGGIVGGLAGKAIAEEVNPTVEHGFWRQHYSGRTYVIVGMPYEEYAPAYQFGWESRARHHDKTFEQAEVYLQHEWDKAKGTCTLAWLEAKEAVHDAWKRVSKS